MIGYATVFRRLYKKIKFATMKTKGGVADG